MNKTLIAAAIATVSLGAGFAANASVSDTAEVISSVPVYERVSAPRQQCYDESVPVNRSASYRQVRRDDRRYDDRGEGIGPGTVLGAVIGGAIGRQFGNSSGGRDRGTVVGAVLGGVIGSQVERDSRHDGAVVHTEPPVRQVEYRTVSRCETVSDYRDEVRGYDVTYRYQGRDYRTRLPYDPGRTMQVRVDVTPERSSTGYSTPNAPSAPRYNRPGYDGNRWN
jgi:uncharacterized protein YcfJ